MHPIKSAINTAFLPRKVKKTKQDVGLIIVVNAILPLLMVAVVTWAIWRSCFYDKVEQEVRSMENTILCESGTCFVTYVYYDGQIATSWYDDLPTLTDSIAKKRRQDGDELLRILNK